MGIIETWSGLGRTRNITNNLSNIIENRRNTESFDKLLQFYFYYLNIKTGRG